MSTTTILHSNPFWTLGITTRDDRRKIVEAAEEKSLHLDHDLCQKARADLTNPRARLAAEMAWMPGVAPRMTEKLMRTLTEAPALTRSGEGVPDLARANLMAAAVELLGENESVQAIAGFIGVFAAAAEGIVAADVLRDVNEDRAISGFPPVGGTEAIEEELAERRKAYRAALKAALDAMPPDKLIGVMTEAVAMATRGGEHHGPALIDDLVDAYEVETQGFLQKEGENITALIASTRQVVNQGSAAVTSMLDKLEKVARNWDRVAQPIQLSARSRGTQHAQSRNLAHAMRNLGIDLNNEHGMLDHAHRMTALLQALFAEMPEFTEYLAADATALADLRRQDYTQQKQDAQWAREISFRADVGVLFKEELAIGPDGISWKGQRHALDSITRVRWGGERHSVNGVSTGTTYTIEFGTDQSIHTIQLRKQSTYEGFLEAFWKAVCIPLIYSAVKSLEKGDRWTCGSIIANNRRATLIKHKFLVPNEEMAFDWADVKVWSSNGSFFVGAVGDPKVYGEASYSKNWNTHLLECIVRSSVKKGGRQLSDFLKD